MITQTNNKKLTNDEKRIKIINLCLDAKKLIASNKYQEAEKIYEKACRIAENVYRQTMSNKDSKTLFECYMKMAEFYKDINPNVELLQRWYQKIVYLKNTTCNTRASLEEYHELLEWYVSTLFLMKDNHKYSDMVTYGFRMKNKAKSLYIKTKTIEDIKFVILANLFIAEGYCHIDKKLKAYYYYKLVATKMEKIYFTILDEGLKYDLIDVYQKLSDLTNKKILKILNRKWSMKKQILKGAD